MHVELKNIILFVSTNKNVKCISEIFYFTINPSIAMPVPVI